MRAIVLSEFGGPEKLRLEEVPTPKPLAGQVLVRIFASALNPVDAKIREGLPIGPQLPAILGADLAGVVEAVGQGVTGFVRGDEVFGCAGGVKGHGGTLAQYIAADARLIAKKPKSISFRDAAALPLVSITAWEAMEKLLPTPADHVLIYGGTGGVGHIGLQMAKATGARVTAVVSSDSAAEIAKSLGADETVMRSDAVSDVVARLTNNEGFSVVFDTVGGSNLTNALQAAAIHGRVGTTNARIDLDLSAMHSKALSLHAVFMLLPMLRDIGRERHGEILQKVASDVEQGKLKPLIDPRHFTLETAPEAHAYLASGQVRGKVVVEID